jgi:beta-phosphoglucomutase
MIKAILFDMDGVLIDARDWHYKALNDALKIFGYEISMQTHLTTFDGLPTKVKLDILSKTEGLPKGLHDLINAVKQQNTLKLSYEKCSPKFNHLKTLRYLSREGFKIAVCSNSIKKTITTMMDLSNLTPFIDLILSNEDVKSPKPDAEIYLKAMDILNVDPNETIILEDNENGLKAAYASKANVLAIKDPSMVSYELIKRFIDEKTLIH